MRTYAHHVKLFVQEIDLTEAFDIKKPFDFVFADVPCSGSGTWGRTPEQLKYFKQEQLATYTELQGKIIENLIPALKLHGHLLFATCSVYKNENENNRYVVEKNNFMIYYGL